VIDTPPDKLRAWLAQAIDAKAEQGYHTAEARERLASAGDDASALLAVARALERLPLRADWRYDEPVEPEAVMAACDPDRPRGALAAVDPAEAEARARTGFLASVCGCQLGKPVECDFTLAELRAGLEVVGAWPLDDYVPDEALEALGRANESAFETTRQTLRAAAPDDDISYTLLGMGVLERHGLGFTARELAGLWLRSLPLTYTWGPERLVLLRAGAATIGLSEDDPRAWAERPQAGDELCGAMIRADAYGYASPGRPERAARLALRDASLTHRRTGVYGSMFAAAAIATAFVVRDPMEVVETALLYVPRASRFCERTRLCLDLVSQAPDWLTAYEQMRERFGSYRHCRVYFETGTMINSLRFARDAGHGICLQVMQGHDTDSYAATAGAILGTGLGPGSLEPRWLKPLRDTIYTTLADFREQRLSAVADRVARLTALAPGDG